MIRWPLGGELAIIDAKSIVLMMIERLLCVDKKRHKISRCLDSYNILLCIVFQLYYFVLYIPAISVNMDMC